MVAKATLHDNRKFGFSMIENDIFDSGTAARIGPYAFSVYSYLVRCAGNGSTCYPTVANIVKTLGISDRTVTRAIGALTKEGLISRQHTKTVNNYKIENFKHTATNTISNSTDRTSDTLQIEPVTPPDRTCDGPLLTRRRHIEKDNRVETVFNSWKEILKHPRAVLDDKRRSKIKKALKTYSQDLLIDAIKGCSKSPYHMGDNDSRTKYDEITLILRDAEHIERFINFNKNPPKPRQKPYNKNEDSRPRRPLT